MINASPVGVLKVFKSITFLPNRLNSPSLAFYDLSLQQKPMKTQNKILALSTVLHRYRAERVYSRVA